MQFGTMDKHGVITSVEVDQSKLTSDCWLIQIQGLKACKTCEVFNTDECGGKAILKKLAEEK